MKIKSLVSLVLVIFIATTLISCSDEENSESDKNQNEKIKVSVKTHKLKAKEFSDYISAVGTIKPLQKALLSSKEGGEIINFLRDKGDYVSKGDTILIIDNEILEANLLAAKAQYELAQITFEKQEMVYKENVNSEIQYLQAKYNLQQIEANYKLIQTRYKNTFIVAPFSGIIDQKYFDERELAPTGQPILLLMNVFKVKVEVGVPEKYIGKIKRGDLTSIIVKAVNKEFTGKVSFVGNSVNVSNRTFPIEITLPNKGRLLKPELIAEVKIQSSTFDKIITIPTEVISRVDGGYVVFVLENGIAKSRKIDILRRTSNEVAVAGGLNDSDEIIVVGYQNLIDGQAVNVVE